MHRHQEQSNTTIFIRDFYPNKCYQRPNQQQLSPTHNYQQRSNTNHIYWRPSAFAQPASQSSLMMADERRDPDPTFSSC